MGKWGEGKEDYDGGGKRNGLNRLTGGASIGLYILERLKAVLWTWKSRPFWIHCSQISSFSSTSSLLLARKSRIWDKLTHPNSQSAVQVHVDRASEFLPLRNPPSADRRAKTPRKSWTMATGYPRRTNAIIGFWRSTTSTSSTAICAEPIRYSRQWRYLLAAGKPNSAAAITKRCKKSTSTLPTY